jgi:hypothetical protein
MQPMAKQAEDIIGGLDSYQSDPGQANPRAGDCGSIGGRNANERYKACLAQQQLRDAEKRSDQIFQDIMKYHDDLKSLVSKMASLNLKEINFKDILELLKEGIKLLAKIRQQWGKLVQFFSMVAVRADVALRQTLVPFTDLAKTAQDLIGEEGELAKGDRLFYLDLLQEQAAEINNIAYFLYTLSSTYFDVSTRFLMDRLAGLAQMLATDNEDQRQQLLKNLQIEADEAQDAIKIMAQQRREQYTRLVNARKRELEDVVQKLGGPN